MKKPTIFVITAAAVIALSAVLYFLFDYRSKSQEAVPASVPDTTSTPNSEAAGVEVSIVKKGSGEGAKAGDVLAVHYTGRLTDGSVFDSSIPRGQPFSFKLGAGQVISGWDTGLSGMKVGEQRRLVIPSEFGYGEQGAGGVIPPNATLIFDVELIGIN